MTILRADSCLHCLEFTLTSNCGNISDVCFLCPYKSPVCMNPYKSDDISCNYTFSVKGDASK